MPSTHMDNDPEGVLLTCDDPVWHMYHSNIIHNEQYFHWNVSVWTIAM